MRHSRAPYKSVFLLPAVAVLLGASQWALGGTWYALSMNNRALVLADLSSIQRTADGAYIQETQIYSASVQVTGMRPVWGQELKIQIDCKTRQARVIQFTAFDNTGAPIGHGDAAGDLAAWKPAGQGFAHPGLMMAACSGKPDPKLILPSSDILVIQHDYLQQTGKKATSP